MKLSFTRRNKLKMPVLREVNINDLRLGNYQRMLKMSKVKAYAQDFDYDLFGTILVSERDGVYYLLDGQHRVETLKLLGINTAIAQVLTGLTYEEEADKFDRLNTQRLSLNSNQKFKARVEKKDKTALEIVKILTKYHFDYTKENAIKSDNCIACVSKLEKIQKNLGCNGLERVIRILRKAWCGDAVSLSSAIVQGIATFLYDYDEIDDNKLISILSKNYPSNILEDALKYASCSCQRPARTDGTCYHVCKVIKDLYNISVPKNMRLA